MRKGAMSKRTLELWQMWSGPMILIGLTLPGIHQGDFRTDSHVYTALIQQMLDGGSWIKLELGDAPYANKPPLAFWFAAPFVWILGPTLIAVRLATLVWGILGLLGTFALIREVATRRLAATTTIVLALTYEYFRYTRTLSLDLPLAVCLVWGTLCLVQCLNAQRKSWIPLALGAGAWLGAGLMVKPGVALAAGLITAIWWMIESRLRRSRASAGLVRVASACLVAVLVAAPWHIATLTGESSQASTYVIDQSLGRGLGTTFIRDPWWTYLHELTKTYWPWLGVVVLGALAWIRIARMHGSHHGDRGAAVRLSLVTIVFWLVVLSAFADKRARYLVPIYPFLSVLVAEVMIAWTAAGTRRAGRAVMLAAPIIAVALGSLGLLASAFGLIRAHAPAAAWRGELLETLESIGAIIPRSERASGFNAFDPGTHAMWVTPDGERPGAWVYLDTGVFPRSLVGDGYAGRDGTTPSPGDVVLIELRWGDAWHELAGESTYLGTFGEFEARRVISWDGVRYIGPTDLRR